MKKIIEIFYDYLWNPQKKHLLIHIIDLCNKENILLNQSKILNILTKEEKNDCSIDS